MKTKIESSTQNSRSGADTTGGWRASLAAVLKAQNGTKQGGSVAMAQAMH